jgi:hypothetical protein
MISDTTFIQALPKGELHLHIEGAVNWALVRQCVPDPLPETPDWWCADFRFPDFIDFGQSMRTAID